MNVQVVGALLSAGDSSGPESHTVLVNGVPVVTLGSLSTGQNGFAPSPAIEGSASVFVNGKPVVRAGDKYAPHSNGLIVIQETALGGAASVRVG